MHSIRKLATLAEEQIILLKIREVKPHSSASSGNREVLEIHTVAVMLALGGVLVSTVDVDGIRPEIGGAIHPGLTSGIPQARGGASG